MAAGIVLAAALFAVVIRDQPDPGPVSFGSVRVGVVALFGLIVLMGVGYYTRLQTYKRGWRGFAVQPAAYVRGNLLLFALLDAAALLALVLGSFVGDRLACFGIATAAFFALLLNFPGGGPMQPSPPRL